MKLNILKGEKNMQAKIIQRGNLKLVVDASAIWNDYYMTEEEMDEECFDFYDKDDEVLEYKEYFDQLLKLNRFVEKIRDEKLKIDIFSLIPLTGKGRFSRKTRFFPLAECSMKYICNSAFEKVGIKTVTSLEQLSYYTKDTDLGISEEECQSGKVAALSVEDYYGRIKKFPLELDGKLTSTNQYIFIHG